MSRQLPPGAKWVTLPSGARRVELLLEVGSNAITGARRQVRRRYPTVEAARAAYLQIATAANQGTLVTRSSRITVDQSCADWLANRRIFIAISVLLMLAGLGSAVVRQWSPGGTEAFNLGVDFKGGTVVTVRFKQRPSAEATPHPTVPRPGATT